HPLIVHYLLFHILTYLYISTAPSPLFTLSLHDALPICLDERVHVHRVSLTKKAVARFKMSRSSRSTRTSLRRLASSSRSLVVKPDRKSTRLNSSHQIISYAVFCLKKKKLIQASHISVYH